MLTGRNCSPSFPLKLNERGASLQGDLRTPSAEHGVHLPVVEGRPAEKEEEVDGRHRAVLACHRVAQRVGPGATQRATLIMSFSLGDGRLIEDSAITTLFLPFVTPNASRLTPLYYEYDTAVRWCVPSTREIPCTGIDLHTWYQVPSCSSSLSSGLPPC